jgi:hypothetical protein
LTISSTDSDWIEARSRPRSRFKCLEKLFSEFGKNLDMMMVMAWVEELDGEIERLGQHQGP